MPSVILSLSTMMIIPNNNNNKSSNNNKHHQCKQKLNNKIKSRKRKRNLPRNN